MIVFDLDGTIALDLHRSHLLKEDPKKWDEYFSLCGSDEPNHPIIAVMEALSFAGERIAIWTGRIDSTKAQTEEWLKLYELDYLVDEIRMREAHDRTEDTELKREWLRQSKELGHEVTLVFEDRQRVVDMWRSEGIVCCQVAPGNF